MKKIYVNQSGLHMTSIHSISTDIVSDLFPSDTNLPLPRDLFCMCISYLVVNGNDRVVNGVDSGFFFNDQKHGEWKSSYSKFVYRFGELHGEYKSWYRVGQLEYHGWYRNGLAHGEYKQWYENGKLSISCSFVDGRDHGEYRQYHENGILAEIFSSDHGLRCGEWKTWNEYGELCSEGVYINGQKYMKC